MDNTPRPASEPKLIKELLDAADEACHAMCDSLNLDFGVGNEDFEDVKSLRAALDRLEAVLDKVKQAGFSF